MRRVRRIISVVAASAAFTARAQHQQVPPERDSFQWLIEYFHSDMNCELLGDTASFWHDLLETIDAPHSDMQTARDLPATRARVQDLSRRALDILMPFGQPEIANALQCPMGVGVLLRELATQVANLGYLERSLRIMHLAQTIVSFNYNNYAPFVANSKWGVQNAGHMIALSTQIQHELPTQFVELWQLWTEEFLVKRKDRVESFEPISAHARLLTKQQHDGVQSAASGLSSIKSSLSNPQHKHQSGGTWEAPPRVAIVSVCIYGNYTKLPDLSGRNKRVYAALQNVELFHLEEGVAPDAHPWMNKLLSLQRALDTNRFDWVMWADCDAFFMDMKTSIQDIIAAATNYHMHADLSLREEIPSSPPSLVITEDGLSLNSGIFLLRNSAWLKKILKLSSILSVSKQIESSQSKIMNRILYELKLLLNI